MTRTKYLLNLLFFSFMISAFAQVTADDAPRMRIEGFSHPESIVLDRENNLIYVSNIGDKKEGDGFISKLTVDGEVLEMRWITGLQDPKGLLLHDGKLFVTDVTEFVEMDPGKGEIIQKIKVEGAKSLNDIAVDAAGNIFFTDLAQNSIYVRDPSGKITEWMHSSKLQQPNGILAQNDSIWIAAWGKESPGHLLALDRKNKNVTRITESGIGNLDGLQRIDNNSFYVSDWASGKIYRINAQGDQQEVLSSAKSSGDILFFDAQQELWLPMNRQNAVWIYSVAGKN